MSSPAVVATGRATAAAAAGAALEAAFDPFEAFSEEASWREGEAATTAADEMYWACSSPTPTAHIPATTVEAARAIDATVRLRSAETDPINNLHLVAVK